MERDDEIKGKGNSLNYTYRMHDPRLGRFFARDPLAWKYVYWSPYAFAGNQVTNSPELEGLEKNYNLNFVEGTVEVRDGKVHVSQLKNSNLQYKPGEGSSTPIPGGWVEVWCKGCQGTPGYDGTFIIMKVPNEKVTRKMTEIVFEDVVVPGVPGTSDKRVPAGSAHIPKGIKESYGGTTEALFDLVAPKKQFNDEGVDYKLTQIIMTVNKKTKEFDALHKMLQGNYNVDIQYYEDPNVVSPFTGDPTIMNVIGHFDGTKTIPGTPATPDSVKKVPVEKQVEVTVDPVEILD
ncbi:MAG: hypothetical protein ACLGGV_01420 [Bacteroidia bacterium]